MTRFLVLFSLFCFCVSSAPAQENRRYTLTGTVREKDGEMLEQANLQLLRARDSSFVSGTVSGREGRFEIGGVPPGDYLLRCSYLGFGTLCRNLSLEGENPMRSVGTLLLAPSDILLKETVITGKIPELVVKEDTVEYHADSYKTAPNATVEELLKKLPGVEVDKDGKVTAQGKEVKKVLVDGEEFFGDDPKMATRNLTADMVDKLQVVDRKSDQARLTGVDDGEDEKVINLTIKKDRKKGWFGNASAGYGTDNRYEASASVNRLRNGNQLMLLGNSNNTNNMGATDRGGSMYSRQRGGGMGFGGGASGINTSSMLGANFNTGNSESFRIGGDVRLSSAEQENRSRTERRNILPDSVSYNNARRRVVTRSNELAANLRMTWQIDSLTLLDFRPTVTLNQSRERERGSGETLDGLHDSINGNTTDNRSDAHGYDLSGRLILTRESRLKKGRQYSVGITYGSRRSVDDAHNRSRNYFFRKDSLAVIDQQVHETQWSDRWEVTASYVEPVFTNRFLTFSYRYSHNTTRADKLAYNLTQEEAPLDSAYSNRFRNVFVSQQFNVSFKTVRPKYNYTVGIHIDPSRTRSINRIDSKRNVPGRTVVNYAPAVNFVYLFSKERTLRFQYRGRTSQPSISQLQPVTNLSNPLIVRTGNPNLNPSYDNRISLRYNDYDRESQRSLLATLSGNYTLNSIVDRAVYNAVTGIQTLSPVNVGGVWNLSGMLLFNRPLRNRKFTVNNHTRIGYDNRVGFNDGRRNDAGTFSASEQAGINYRSDRFDLSLRGNCTYQSSRHSVRRQSDLDIVNFGGNLGGTLYLPFALSLSSDLDYSGNAGYADSFRQHQWLWNARLDFQFLKEKTATLTLKVYDILQQRSSVRRTVTGNYIEDGAYNALTSYGMLSFTYRFNRMGRSSNRQLPAEEGFRPGPPPGERPGEHEKRGGRLPSGAPLF